VPVQRLRPAATALRVALASEDPQRSSQGHPQGPAPNPSSAGRKRAEDRRLSEDGPHGVGRNARFASAFSLITCSQYVRDGPLDHTELREFGPVTSADSALASASCMARVAGSNASFLLVSQMNPMVMPTTKSINKVHSRSHPRGAGFLRSLIAKGFVGNL
jgi:hypothetical protein